MQPYSARYIMVITAVADLTSVYSLSNTTQRTDVSTDIHEKYSASYLSIFCFFSFVGYFLMLLVRKTVQRQW